MEKYILESAPHFIASEERIRLVRLCGRITGNIDAAEDLAQETLLEAWHSENTLRDPTRRPQWLTGIARNVCLRWLHKHSRAGSKFVTPLSNIDMQDGQDLADGFDLELELEQKELADLLDRAMALLPAETRTVLIKRYIEESPLADIADQLHTNTSAVSMRLQRGKLHLRKLLTQHMGPELAPYQPATATNAWEETPLWCHNCGQHHLLGRRKIVGDEGELILKCPQCSPGPNQVVSNSRLPILKEVKGYKPLYSRLVNWCNTYYRTGLEAGSVACSECGRTIPTRLLLPEEMPNWLRAYDKIHLPVWLSSYQVPIVAMLCSSCLIANFVTLDGLVLSLPAGRHFQQSHPRIRTLPYQAVEFQGRLAHIARFESVTETASLTIISAADTYEVLHIAGGNQ